jgi:hypothetical protein
MYDVLAIMIYDQVSCQWYQYGQRYAE